MERDCSKCTEIELIKKDIDNIKSLQAVKDAALDEKFSELKAYFTIQMTEMRSMLNKMMWGFIGGLGSIVLIVVAGLVALL